MGLHDRLKGGSGNGDGASLGEAAASRADQPVVREHQQPERTTTDPYAELKTRVHHARPHAADPR
jgi:hypothetical protein